MLETSIENDGAPAAGEVLEGKYRIERVLGRGGMGVVVEATHLVLGEAVAIKTLLPELATDEQTVQRFLREARAVAKIESEHVARVLDVGRLPNDAPYLVMEYLEGEDLQAMLARTGPLPYATAIAYVLEACEALAEAHAIKIIHRDLKPSNLFVATTRRGHSVKVLDFGISKMMGEGDLTMTRTKQIMGSPLYMSPEQLRNTRDVDARSDIWSLGVIVFELVSGQPPFPAQSIAELGAMVLSGDAPRLSNMAKGIPEELSAVIATCLRRDPADRFVNLADFAAALAPFAGEAGRTSTSRILATLDLPKERAKVVVPKPRTPSVSEAASTVPFDLVTPKSEEAAFGASTNAPVSARVPKTPTRSRFVVLGGLAALIVAAIVATAVFLRWRASAVPAYASASAPASVVRPPESAAPPPEPAKSVASETPPPAPKEVDSAKVTVSPKSKPQVPVKTAPSTVPAKADKGGDFDRQ